jgi:TolB-like protein/Flp pilus assembly protein TadD
MVTGRGQAKVLDFGLAMLLRPEGEASQVETMSQEYAAVGTLPYMAPEQLRGETVDARSDIYAAGAVLFEMATRQRPFPQKTAPRLIDAIQHEAPPTPSTVNRRISPALDGIILKALDKDPRRRYQSAADLRVDLERLAMPMPLLVARRHPGPRRGWPVIAAAGLLAVTAILLGLNVGGIRDRLLGRPAPGRIRSLAVLPLRNLSGDPGQEYFADGMTEELITDLAKIGPLRVISRTSVMHYKGSDRPLPEIARALNVDAIVEGSVLRSKDRVRITAQLVEGTSDRHLWAESYERDLKDVLALQSEVAQAIASQIEVTLSPAAEAGLARGARPVSSEAHEAYLKGRYHWNRRMPADLKKSIEYFQQAIEREPDYGLAYAALSLAYVTFATWWVEPPTRAFPRARAAALKALEVDEGLADAHTALANTKCLYEWDWSGAEREFRRVTELSPNDPTAHEDYGFCLALMGRIEEAIAEVKLARDLDPLSLSINGHLGEIYRLARQYDAAIDQFRKAQDLNPSFPQPHAWMAMTYAHMGRLKEGLVEGEAAQRFWGQPLPMNGYVLALSGRRAEALDILAGVRHGRTYFPPFFEAMIYAGLGEDDRMFEALERAFVEREDGVSRLKVDPTFDRWRSDPRFKVLLRRMNFPE